MSKEKSLLKPIVRNCRTCGCQFEISAASQQKLADEGKSFPTHCPDCIDKKRAGRYEKCRDCGEQFFVSELEQEQYEKKNLAPRKRCWVCVEKRRERGNET